MTDEKANGVVAGPGGANRLSLFLGILGPGILYAGAAVGVSHLVQATRAGAMHGLGLTAVILLACVIKYPALRFGGEFTAASGKTLIESYRKTGWWAIGIYAAAQVMSMFFAVAAVTLVNVGLVKTVLGIETDDRLVALLLLALAAVLLLSGRYHLLERIVKAIVALFTLLIVLTTALVVGTVDWSWSGFALPPFSVALGAFVIALMGFMPSPMDACVVQSLWTAARGRDQGRMPSPTESRMDFSIGYTMSLVLALCFMLLGTAVMHQAGVAPVEDSAGFAGQVIKLFTDSIGDWVYPVIAVAAVAVMFSTLLTLLDAYPRVVAGIFDSVVPSQGGKILNLRVYDGAVILVCGGVIAVMTLFMESFTAFIDLTAVIVFLTGPILAYLNHRAITGEDVPPGERPGAAMRLWSLCGIGAMLALALVYLYFRVAV